MPKIQIRRATSAQWASANPILSSGELGLDKTVTGLKIGDGTANWANLGFLGMSEAALDLRYQKLTSSNVKDFGAVGDGIHDDGPAFQEAIDYARGTFGFGGTVYVPPAMYNILPRLRLRSKVNITGYGAVLTKTSTAAGYAVFHSRSDGAKGYGSGDSNIIIRGLEFKGSFNDNIGLCGFALHHSDDIQILDCDFTECVISGHAIDLSGSSNILIDNCTFKGFKYAGGGWNKEEAIQMDLSIADGASAPDAAGSWDGLATKNVKVRNSRFLPLTVGGTAWPAPNPIGSHAIYENRAVSNIEFSDNYVLDPLVDITSDVRGVLHFIGVNGLKVKDNLFEFSTPVSTIIVGLYSTDWGVPAAGANYESGATNTSGTMAPLACKDILIQGNKLKNFGNTLGAGQITIAPIAGHGNVPAVNVRILRNDFELINVAAAATNFIAASYVEGLILDDMNVFTGPGRPINASFVNGVTYGKNRAIGPRADAFRSDNCTRLRVNGINATNCAGTAIYTIDSSRVQLGSSNSVHSLGGSRAIALNNVTNFSVIDQEVTAPAGTIGIQVYGTSANGRVTLCNISGGTTNHVDISAVTANNVTEPSGSNIKLAA